MFQTVKYHPRSLFMQGIAEYYQVIETAAPLRVHTLPNGRVDAWITLSGGFGFIDKVSEAFSPAPADGFFPLSNEVSFIMVQKSLRCLNIKFFPHILGFPSMKKLQLCNTAVRFEDLFGQSFQPGKERSEDDIVQLITSVEAWFTDLLYADMGESLWLQDIIAKMEKDTDAPVTVKRLAKEAHMTVKTLERKFSAALNISPKLFCRIIRFQKAVKDIQEAGFEKAGAKLSLSLANGYHDQSHFIKDSKAITGEAPKKLLKKMINTVPDVIIKSS